MDKKWLWSGKPWQAFKSMALFFSFGMNLIMLVAMLALAPLIIPIVSDIARPIVGGLNSSFVDMSSAKIQRVIEVDDTLDVEFTLPVEASTTVVIYEDVALEGVPARFVLPGGGGVINGQVYLSLPDGLSLPVQLSLDVPVRNTIPVKLAVAVDIPLNETELGEPFNKLESLFGPLDELLQGLPATNDELLDRVLQKPGDSETPAESVTAR